MSKGGGQQQVQTTTSSPPAYAQPYLQHIVGEAQNLYQNYGPKYFQGDTVAPLSSQSQGALSGIEGAATAGNPLLSPALSSAQGILSNNGVSPDQTAAMDPARKVASGELSIGTDQLRQFASGEADPNLQKLIADQQQKVADQVKSSYGGMGRYGSSSMNRDLADRLGILGNQAIDTDRSRQLQALGLLQQTEGANIANRVGAGQSIADMYGTGLSRAMQQQGMVPGLNDMRYADLGKLGGVGAAYDTRAQDLLNADIQKFNFGQQQPWTNLANYASLVSGGTVGGSQTQTKPSTSPVLNALGGGATGAGIAGLLGLSGPLGIGAAGLGGLLGLLA